MSDGLLAALTRDESDRLWWRLIRAIAATTDEIECLTLAPEQVRDSLYGKGCLPAYRDMRAELIDLAGNDLPVTVSAWKTMLADTESEGNPSWHDSETATPTRPVTSMFLASRAMLTKAARRMWP